MENTSAQSVQASSEVPTQCSDFTGCSVVNHDLHHIILSGTVKCHCWDPGVGTLHTLLGSRYLLRTNWYALPFKM